MIKNKQTVFIRCIVAILLFGISLIMIFKASEMSTEEKFVKSLILSANKGHYNDIIQKIGYFDFSSMIGMEESDYDKEDTLSLIGINILGNNSEIEKVKTIGFYERVDGKYKTVNAIIQINYTDDGEKKIKDMTKTYNFININDKWVLDDIY